MKIRSIPTLLVGSVAFLIGCQSAPAEGRAALVEPTAPMDSRNTGESVASPMLPTPYTADEIRHANPPGTEVVFRIQADGSPTVHQSIAFRDCGRDDAVQTVMVMQSASGQPLGEPTISVATWEELRLHAEFPRATTQASEATINVPAGTFDCWFYTVETRDDAGTLTVTRYWFSKHHPGPPVYMETEADGAITMRMSLVAGR